MTPSPIEENVRKRSVSDFLFGKVIGEGSFSTVYLGKDIHTGKEFAIKVLEKRHIIKEKKLQYVEREKKVLQLLNGVNEFFVKLYCTFQDPERLYFVLTYAKNGELLSHINKSNSFSYACVQYYTAEIVLALESLCSKGIIHRDLKPENILFDENWHILITDFGSAKILNSVDTPKISMEPSKSRKNSFVGTAQYVSPELLTDSAEASFSCDLWALGCIIYQMVAGVPPFRGGSEYLIFQKILKLDYEFPEGFNQTIRDLVENLLVLDPNARLGSTDTRPYSSIREHEFFKDVNWTNLGVPPIIASREIDTQEEIIEIPDDIEPGLDEQKASRLHLEQFYSPKNKKKISDSKKSIVDIDKEEIERQLLIQKNDKWHNLVEGNLILKKGLVDKRKGLFPRRRMLLLTLGPHLYYVDPTCMVLKGEIPWSSDLKVEAKNFKTFFVHTPNRTYYLEDPEGYALEWCRVINEVKEFYYPERLQ